MPEWLIERGIGETRAALIDNGEVVEARIELDCGHAGTVVAARLVDSGLNGRNSVARDESGVEYLLPRGAPNAAEGALINVEVTRGAIPGAEPWKRPLARVTEENPREARRLSGRELTFSSPADELGRAGWNDLIDEARSGIVRFEGGELRVSVTPAMTLMDVDGYLEAGELAERGAREAARAIRRLDIGGSIGIDLPTSGSKAARQAAAAAIDEHLPQPFERTAVNGFGFLQVVRPRSRASLIELAQDRAAFEARALLRRAAFEAPGPKRLVAHPMVIAALEAQADWTAALSRQAGGAVSLRADAALPMSGGYA
ncbi:MAG: ribonuclease [Sphingomicrobium sp.]